MSTGPAVAAAAAEACRTDVLASLRSSVQACKPLRREQGAGSGTQGARSREYAVGQRPARQPVRRGDCSLFADYKAQ